MTDTDARVAELLAEAARGRASRRQLVQRGLALGLSMPAIAAALGPRAAAQDATPAADGVIPIIGRALSPDELRAEIENEGEVTVGNWTYTANDALVERFQTYVQETYGVEITLNYEASQAPSTYITNLYTALQSGNPSTYDVMAIEENYWAEAIAQPEPVLEEFLPSPLIPNADRVLDMFKHVPTSIGFQASASPGIVYDTQRAGYLKDWTDLADERLRQKLTMPLPGDITAGGILIGLAGALGKDWMDDDQMKEVVDFAVDEIGPNVLQYTTSSADMQQLLRNGVIDACGFWNSLARLEFLQGQENTAFMIAESGQYLINGFMWIPKNAQHPVLAQIFVDWRLSDDGQFPSEAWGIENGPWAEYNEGLLGPSYEPLIPEWFKEDYFTYYPTIEQLTQQYKSIDWTHYAAHQQVWMDYYSERLGL
jgi:spermidine/putrescine-binding protein